MSDSCDSGPPYCGQYRRLTAHNRQLQKWIDDVNEPEFEAVKAELDTATKYAEAYFDESELLKREVAKLRAALEGLHDWYVEYARINNLFNADGSPATFHELLVARSTLNEETK